jgi:hypothetical protein
MITVTPLGAECIVEHFEPRAGFGIAAPVFQGVHARFFFARNGFGAGGVAGGFVAAAGFGLSCALFGRSDSHGI